MERLSPDSGISARYSRPPSIFPYFQSNSAAKSCGPRGQRRLLFSLHGLSGSRGTGRGTRRTSGNASPSTFARHKMHIPPETPPRPRRSSRLSTRRSGRRPGAPPPPVFYRTLPLEIYLVKLLASYTTQNLLAEYRNGLPYPLAYPPGTPCGLNTTCHS